MFQRISKGHMIMSRVSVIISAPCLIVGIVGDAMNVVPGLEPTNWFIIGVGWLIVGCWNVFIGLAESIKE